MDGQAAASSVLQLSTFTTVQSIPRKDRYSDFPVTVRVTAPAMEVHQQCPVDIVAVVDISGSMTLPAVKDPVGIRTTATRMDVVKDAMRNVIQKLGAKNRLAVVPFNDQLQPSTSLTVMDEQGQKNTTHTVKSLKAADGTKFSLGLNKAVQILDNRPAGDKDRLAFIVFLSDGEDDSFQKGNIPKKYPIHAFGISKEHQADTLQAMAEVTSGSYTPIVQDLEKITEKLAQLTDMLISVVAVDMRVDLRSAHTGVSLSRIDSQGDKFKSSISDDKQSGTINVPSLSSGEQREFIVYLDVPEGDADADTMDVLSVGGAYTQSWDTKQVDLTSSVVSVVRPAPPSDKDKGDYKDQDKDGHKDQGKDGRKDQGKEDGKDQGKDDGKDQGKEDDKDQGKDDRKDHGKGDCKELEWIEKRVQYWCKVKLDLMAMYDETKGSAAAAGDDAGCQCQCQVAAALWEASLGSIDQAMHHDVYTAAVYAIQMRKCRTSGATENVPTSA